MATNKNTVDRPGAVLTKKTSTGQVITQSVPGAVVRKARTAKNAR